jgi:toxin-antitoxin system PIN domain toxin
LLAVDTNILVYAHRREVPEHLAAARIVRQLAESPEPWAIPWPCVYEFFSVVTHPRIWRGSASTPRQAWNQIVAWLSSPTLRLLAETQEFSTVLARLLTLPRVRGSIVHDARIAALCIAHGVDALLSRDRDFSLFAELSTSNPL